MADEKAHKKYKYMAYVLLAVFFISLIILCICRKRIKVLIIILKCAAHFVGDVWYALFVPPVFYLVCILNFSFWASTAVYLYTVGTLNPKNQLPFGQFVHDNKTYYMFYFWLFGGLWGFAMLLAL